MIDFPEDIVNYILSYLSINNAQIAIFKQVCKRFQLFIPEQEKEFPILNINDLILSDEMIKWIFDNCLIEKDQLLRAIARVGNVELFVKMNVEEPISPTIRDVALRNGCVKFLEFLQTKDCEWTEFVFDYSLSCGVDMYMWVMKNKPEDLIWNSNQNETAAHLIRENKIDVFNFMLDQGIVQSNSYFINVALESKNFELFERLNKGSIPYIFCIKYFAKYGMMDYLEKFFKSHDVCHTHVLIIGAIEGNRVDVLERMKDKMFVYFSKYHSFYEQRCSIEITRWLIGVGVSVNSLLPSIVKLDDVELFKLRDKTQLMTFEFWCMGLQINILKYLFDEKSLTEANVSKYSLIVNSAHNKDYESFHWLLEKFDIDSRTAYYVIRCLLNDKNIVELDYFMRFVREPIDLSKVSAIIFSDGSVIVANWLKRTGFVFSTSDLETAVSRYQFSLARFLLNECSWNGFISYIQVIKKTNGNIIVNLNWMLKNGCELDERLIKSTSRIKYNVTRSWLLQHM